MTVLIGFRFPDWLLDMSDKCCLSSQGKDQGLWCPVFSACRAWIHWAGGGGGSKREKTPPAGNRMHMALRRMTGWIQEMERKGEEGDILDHSCVQIEKFLFWSAERHFVVLSPDHKEAEEQLAAARVKCGCGGDSSFCFHARETWRMKIKSSSYLLISS